MNQINLLLALKHKKMSIRDDDRPPLYYLNTISISIMYSMLSLNHPTKPLIIATILLPLLIRVNFVSGAFEQGQQIDYISK